LVEDPPAPGEVINEHFSEKLRECSRARKIFFWGGNNEYRLAAIRLELSTSPATFERNPEI
jgi:hypothetical protein